MMDDFLLLSIKINGLISLLSRMNQDKQYTKVVGDIKINPETFLPHIWIVDNQNNIIDKFGDELFVKTGLIKKLDNSDYVFPVRMNQIDPLFRFKITFGHGFKGFKLNV